MNVIIQILITIFGSCAIVFNSIMCILIYFKSGSEIGNYKFLLLLYVSITLTNAIVELSCIPIYDISSTDIFIIATNPYMTNKTAGAILLYVFCYGFIGIVITLLCSYAYRYAILCKAKWSQYLTDRWGILRAYSFIFIACSVFEFVTGMACIPSAGKAKRIEELAVKHNLSTIYPPYVGMSMEVGEKWEQNWAFYCILMWIPVMGLTAFGIVYFLTKMFSLFRSTSDTASIARNKVQKRLFILLTFQTAIPVFFTLIPTVLLDVTTQFHVDLEGFSTFYSIQFSFTYAVDPMLIFFLIGDYRKSVFRCLNCRKNHVRSVSNSRQHQSANNGTEMRDITRNTV